MIRNGYYKHDNYSDAITSNSNITIKGKMMNKMKKLTLGLLIGCMSALSYAAAPMGDSIITLNSTATMNGVCKVSAGEMAFGEVTPFGQGMTGTGQIVSYKNTEVSVQCSNNVLYEVSLTSVPGTTFRSLKGSGGNIDQIAYTLCQGPFPCAVGVNNNIPFISDIGNGTTQSKTLYGMVRNGYYQPDNYSDTVTLTVRY